MSLEKRKIQVLVVDDSITVRRTISDILNGAEDIEVIATAPSGKVAMTRLAQMVPDVITLDVEMPEMSGIDLLRRLRVSYSKIPVIMCSAFTDRGARATIQALEIGAVDCIMKPSGSLMSLQQFSDELIRKVRANGVALDGTIHSAVPSPQKEVHVDSVQVNSSPRQGIGTRHRGHQFEVVAIGSSTGGPNALQEVLPLLPQSFSKPIVITQHMPPVFTRMLAERLDKQSHIKVVEAQGGMVLSPGTAYIAPGDFHMTFELQGAQVKVVLNQDAPEHSCRPAVDPMLRSLASIYHGSLIAIILTGMGADGTEGCRIIRRHGGMVIAQDQESSVVWGMPGSVVKSDSADFVLPLRNIAETLSELDRNGSDSGIIKKEREARA